MSLPRVSLPLTDDDAQPTEPPPLSPGGIGPTPDDITYQSIAKAFDGEPLAYHEETLRRMQENLAARRRDQGEVTEDVSVQSDLGRERQLNQSTSGWVPW